MIRRLAGAALLVWLLSPAPAAAQEQHQPGRLATLFQNLFGPSGLIVNSEEVLPDGSTHSAHFNSAFQSNFTQFNVALAAQLTALPLPSPASGFTYTFDAATGTFRRTTTSFGPILADRAETIGRGRLSFGFNYQFFSFDSLGGVPLNDVPAVFTHDDFELGGGRADIVETRNDVRASVGQMTGLLTYGITDRLDVSIAVPIIRTSLDVLSNATIQRLGTDDAVAVHFFRDPNAPNGFGNFRQFQAEATASGLGDLIIRGKSTVLQNGHTGLAIGADLRLPTGDEMDLLGSGAMGFRPFAAFSTTWRGISPHVNLAYQWNGDSVLAADPAEGTKADLPDQWTLVIGADSGVTERLSLAGDVLVQRVIDSPRLVQTQFTSPTILLSTPFDDITFETASFTIVNGAIGMKVNVTRRLLVNFNLLFKLNDQGLRDRVTPLVGFELGI